MSEDGLDPQRCPHLAEAFADDTERSRLIKKYKSVVAWKAQRLHETIHPAKRQKISAPTCGTCGLSLSRPFACLHCGYSGCWQDEHVTEHLKDEGHFFCADVKLGLLFCIECDDFIYDATIDSLFNSTVLAVEESNSHFQVNKKAREIYRPWHPSAKDAEALDETTSIPCQGRRGLLNLGQTCFLNVILQSIIHNPLLRNYFLSDKHNSKLCKHKECTCCEIDKLFTEVYTSSPTPYGPTSLLIATWRASSDLSGYSQQDAHECFIALLNGIHNTCRGHTNISCNCVVHSTFAGQLQSDLKCERCGYVNGTVDPCLDISLELREGNITLADCLKRFTQQEKLGAKEYSCPKCDKGPHEISKRLSIRKLPPVLSFQFKRFEHKTADRLSAQKIDLPVRVPASINMAPYTTLAATRKSSDDPSLAAFSYPGPEVIYEYDLFAVINHEGQIDNGHYTNFARLQDDWYRFDDDKVTPSTLPAVLSAPIPIYMAFYVKRRLDYKPDMTPSYVLTRETEAVREREQEKEKERLKEREEREREERAREDREREDKEREEREKEVEDELLATV